MKKNGLDHEKLIIRKNVKIRHKARSGRANLSKCNLVVTLKDHNISDFF